jgi:uroporphyrinogen decarboxylase
MEMTKRERIMAACRGEEADRVPAAPDISNMIPCRMTGKEFWNVYLLENPPLWKAYVDAAEYFDFEMWLSYGGLRFHNPVPVETTSRIIRHADFWEKEVVYHTPKGDLTERIHSYRDNSPTSVEKVVKNFPEDLPKLKYFFQEPLSADASGYRHQQQAVGENGFISVGIFPPGFQTFLSYFNGNLEALTYAYYDYPDEFSELIDAAAKSCLRRTELAVDAKVDSVLTGGSGSVTLQSPELFDRMCLPVIRQQTHMCRQAGVLSGIHSCGKEMHVLEVCAEQTELDYINPLEIPPMGDSTLKEAKRRFGGRLAIMGNIHTTDVMLRGSPELVERESLQAILDAGEGGGFVLSTGDQCGRDTPDENIFALVNAAKEYGTYPLNRERIQERIHSLNGKIQSR